MFGIFFLNHNNLQRLIADYGFIGYPLRKDFPLSGYIELFYNERKARIFYQKVEFVQEHRNFYFSKL
jgi:NADH:ubiquinone oxidoreductase subunit C